MSFEEMLIALNHMGIRTRTFKSWINAENLQTYIPGYNIGLIIRKGSHKLDVVKYGENSLTYYRTTCDEIINIFRKDEAT